MRIKKGRDVYKIPRNYQVITLSVRKPRCLSEIMLTWVRRREFEQIRYASSQGATTMPTHGMPQYMLLHEDGRHIQLYPMPDENYIGRLVYAPPLRVR